MNRSDPYTLLQTIVQRAGSLVGTKDGYIYILDDGGKTMTVKVGTGLFKQYIGLSITKGEGLAGSVWETGKPIIIDDYDAWHGRKKDFPRSIFHSIIGVPLNLDKNVIGVIALVHAKSKKVFGASETLMLSRFAELAAVAFDNARLYQVNQQEIEHRKKLENQKDEFLGIASHELKTPVTSLKAFGQVLHRRFMKTGDIESAHFLEKMDAQINRLTNLIQDLLDISKIEGGRLQFHNEEVAFDEVVADTVEEIQRTTDRHTIQVGGRTNKIVYTDRERINQVIINFLTNAIKYTPHGGPIRVVCSVKDSSVQVCVQDYGVGIPAEHLPHIFERFYRVKGKSLDTIPGMGIGLYISAEIIRRQGGSIWVESEEGKGSNFCFSIPLQKRTIQQQKNTMIREEVEHE